MNKLNKNKTPVFICIGAKRSYYDGIAYRIGVALKKEGHIVINDINNVNMEKKLEEVMEYKGNNNYELIAIDLSITNQNDMYSFGVLNSGIKPGNALGRLHRRLGSKSIHIFYKIEGECVGLEDIFELCKGHDKIHDEKFEKLEKTIIEKLIKYYKK